MQWVIWHPVGHEIRPDGGVVQSEFGSNSDVLSASALLTFSCYPLAVTYAVRRKGNFLLMQDWWIAIKTPIFLRGSRKLNILNQLKLQVEADKRCKFAASYSQASCLCMFRIAQTISTTPLSLQIVGYSGFHLASGSDPFPFLRLFI